MQFLLAALTLCLLSIATANASSDVYYVRTSRASCPGMPWNTLSRYALLNNFTSGSILSFMPGHHSLGNHPLTLRGISNITLREERGNVSTFYTSAAHIVCTNTVTIRCENISNLTIEGLSFILDQGALYGGASAIYFIDCIGVYISSTAFEGSGEGTGQAIYLRNTSAIILQCLFEGNSAFDNGGAISLENTILAIYQSNLIKNEALDPRFGNGGAIYANRRSTLRLYGRNHFGSNYARNMGGAINCYHCTVEVRGQLTFHDNHCGSNSQGGALDLTSGRFYASGTIDFSGNRATRGGAYSMDDLVKGNFQWKYYTDEQFSY